MVYLLLILGFILLVKGADFFVDGATGIAHAMKIPSVIIGLTIVAFGTSAPEAAVSITAAIKGANEISFGNVVGSNIFNLLVVAGVSSAIVPLSINKQIIKRDFPFSIIGALILALFASGIFGSAEITRLGGAFLLILFIIYMIIVIRSALKSKSSFKSEQPEKALSISKSILFSIIGLSGIIIGGQLVVNSASDIARILGVSETVIGLTIVAIGTSLPELVTSITAARKGENDIAMGNVIGSNIFNIFFILGISAALNPIKVDFNSMADSIILIAASVIALAAVAKKQKLNRSVGVIMTILYVAYTIYILLR